MLRICSSRSMDYRIAQPIGCASPARSVPAILTRRWARHRGRTRACLTRRIATLPADSPEAMTLNLIIAAPWGLWLSTDFRVTDSFPSGRSVPRTDHWSPKYFQALTARREVLAITYAGAAEVTAIEPELIRVVTEAEMPEFDNVPGR